MISGVDLVLGEDPESLRAVGPTRWRIKALPNSRWRLQELKPQGAIHQIQARDLALRGAFLRSAEGPLPPRVALRRVQPMKQAFHVIGRLSLRDYLIGVVSHEMPTSWPLHTLKAQAVAARSYTLKTRQERQGRGWDVESTIEDQVYRDVSSRKDLTQVRAAVISTDGVVLLGPGGQEPLKAFYHADCGGQTVPPSQVWGQGPDFGTAVDPQCPSSPRSRWTLALSEGDFLKRLGRAGERLLGIEMLAPGRGASKAERFRLRLRSGTVVMDANELRLKVGSTELKSTKFSVRSQQDQLVFEGKGFGHGAGLCQWGSRHLGQSGYDFTKILAHYYPRATLNVSGN